MLSTLKTQCWRWLFCPFGKHVDVGKANFCCACGHQLNHDAYKPYEVELYNGSKFKVKAVNPKHAQNIIVHNKTEAITESTGASLANTKISPCNIKSVERLESN